MVSQRVISASLLFITFIVVFAPSVSAFTTNMDASVVIGQSDFQNRQPNHGDITSGNNNEIDEVRSNEKGFDFTYSNIIVNDKLVVSDYNNNRFLIYNKIPTTNDVSADIVIGQTNMNANLLNQNGLGNFIVGPNTIRHVGNMATDGKNLMVVDYSNQRVLIYNTLPTTNNPAADVEIGQPSMATAGPNVGGISASAMAHPWALEIHKPTGRLYITDQDNFRILVWDHVPRTNGEAAVQVIGQKDFTSNSFNRGGPIGPTTLTYSYSVHFINNKFVVSDTGNNRVLIWNKLPASPEDGADVVVGQKDMYSGSANQGNSSIPKANTLSNPVDTAYLRGEFFVVDNLNNRILIYNGMPTTNNASAYKVIGQPNMTSNSVNQVNVYSSASSLSPSAKANTLAYPYGLTVYKDKLILNDTSNHRVLIYNNVTKPLEKSPVITPQATTATINWQTKTPMTAIVEYGLTPEYDHTTDNYEPKPLETNHSVTLKQLRPCTVYHFRITSTAGDRDNVGTIEDLTFITKGTNCQQKDVGVTTVSLQAEISRADANVARSFTPIVFTAYTAFSQTNTDKSSNLVEVKFADGKSMRLQYRSQKNGLSVWKGTYNLPIAVTTNTKKTLDGKVNLISNVGTSAIQFSFDPRIPGLHSFESNSHTFKAIDSDTSFFDVTTSWIKKLTKKT